MSTTPASTLDDYLVFEDGGGFCTWNARYQCRRGPFPTEAAAWEYAKQNCEREAAADKALNARSQSADDHEYMEALIEQNQSKETTMGMTKNKADELSEGERSSIAYFGGCPHCGLTDGYLNVGRSQWFVCHEHKIKWCVASNVFSSWRHQTEAEQRVIYDKHGVGKYREISCRICVLIA